MSGSSKNESKARKVVDIRTTLGEGAFWDAGTQTLLWLDILESRVFRFDPATGQNRVYDVGAHVGTVVPRRAGGALVALRTGLATLDLETGAVEVKARARDTGANFRFNDGKCDPSGRLWVGSMTYDFAEGAGGLYRVGADFSVMKVLSGFSIPNGIAWTHDRKIMYHVDTPTARIDAFDYDDASGTVSNRRTVVTIDETHGSPDGMTMDEEGMLWVAHWKGEGVRRWNPNTGELLQVVPIPASQVTSCAFGGTDFETLYVTCASEGLSEAELARHPDSGALFAVDVGVKGFALPTFAG